MKERNRYLVDIAKKEWIKTDKGNIKCSICAFSFIDTYGEVGEGYIEAHHILPVSEVTANTIVTIADLTPVCSNCHRIIHRHRPWLSIEAMKKIVKENEEHQK